MAGVQVVTVPGLQRTTVGEFGNVEAPVVSLLGLAEGIQPL